MSGTDMFEQLDLRYASSSVQGRRPYNEDRAYSVHPLLGTNLIDRSTSFFAVYDGHGGEECAEWTSRHLHNHIARSPAFHSQTKTEALEHGFFACDEELLLKHADREAESGTTCSCILIDRNHIYSGNCGDSRTILCRAGAVIPLTIEHKPTDEFERVRIEAAGAKVTIHQPPVPKKQSIQTMRKIPIQAYVELGDCGLAVSRAFGDRLFKMNKDKPSNEQVIVCTPHLKQISRSPDDEFVILASDGLWNFISEEKVVEFVQNKLNSTIESERDVEDIVHKLTQLALDKKSNDNVTVTLITFTHSNNQSNKQSDNPSINQ